MVVFGVSVVETYNLATQSLAYEETYHALFYALNEEIIDKNIASRPNILPSRRTGINESPILVRTRPTAHLF